METNPSPSDKMPKVFPLHRILPSVRNPQTWKPPALDLFNLFGAKWRGFNEPSHGWHLPTLNAAIRVDPTCTYAIGADCLEFLVPWGKRLRVHIFRWPLVLVEIEMIPPANGRSVRPEATGMKSSRLDCGETFVLRDAQLAPFIAPPADDAPVTT